MKKFKNILVGILIGVIAIIVLFAVFGKKENRENEIEKEKLIMVTEAGFAPYEFYEGEEIVGVDVEIAKVIAEKTGKELEINQIHSELLPQDKLKIVENIINNNELKYENWRFILNTNKNLMLWNINLILISIII